ncbi:MAG: hypothetical protein RML35_07120 [Chloroherpetonaceae bacterium]|nr:hypothetical protein [Chloroherpetonaceae bacterium]
MPITAAGKLRYAEAIRKGVRHFATMRIAEIYDVIQKDKHLREPDWKGKAFSEYDHLRIEYPLFSPTALEPQSYPQFQRQFAPFFTTLFAQRYPGYVGTVKLRGAPNISPRFIIAAQENFLLWGDRFKNKTFFNFSRPSPITVFAPNPETGEAFLFKGWARFHFFGKTVVMVNEAWHQIGFKDPMQAVHFYPEEIERILPQQNMQRYYEARPREKWLPPPVLTEQRRVQSGSAEVEKGITANKLEALPRPTIGVAGDRMPRTDTRLRAIMLSDEPLALELVAPLKPDIDVSIVPLERYDRSYLVKTDVVMAVFGNRATEVDLFYLRCLLDAAAFYSETSGEHAAVRFIVFIAAFEKSPSLKAMMNALEIYVKMLNQVGKTKVELMFIWLPAHLNAKALKADVRQRVSSLLFASEFGELNYLRLHDTIDS